jgi:heme/copper-type cytochrome/quinol oxidase subunit 2
MKKLFKNIIVITMVVFLLAPVLAIPASAQNLGIEFASNLGLQNSAQSDPRDMAVDIVKYLMTFLGIIAVVVILLGGFKWMTAAGNEDKVAEAKKLIIAGVIGLIIILASFAIVQFVVSITGNALNGTGF